MSAPLAYNSLYIALFWNIRSYHWGLLAKTSEWDLSPESLFHAVNPAGGWKFDVKNSYNFEGSGKAVFSLKIASLDRAITNQKLQEILASVPVVNGDDNFNCKVWVEAALKKLCEEHIVTCANIHALMDEASMKASAYRGGVERGENSWGCAVSSVSR